MFALNIAKILCCPEVFGTLDELFEAIDFNPDK